MVSQTKRKVKIRQHIAQLHIKTQAVNCPNFKRKKAETKTKTVAQLVYTCKTLRNTRYCKACMGKCEYDDEPTFLGRWVSEAEHARVKGEIEMKIIKIEALQLAIMTIYNPRIKILVGENAKLKTEVEQLKAVRDALGKSNKNALADRNTFIKKVEVLEGRIEKAVQGDFEFLWKEYGLASDENLTKDAICLKRLLFGAVEKVGLKRLTELEERLEAIRQWREKYKDKPVGVWAMSELGVLLASGEKKPWPEWLRKAIDELPEESEPKELDQKTREGDSK